MNIKYRFARRTTGVLQDLIKSFRCVTGLHETFINSRLNKTLSLFMLLLICGSCVKYNVNGTIAPVFVSTDRNNHRILLWYEKPGFNQPADLIIGQPTTTANTVDAGGGSVGQYGFHYPWGAATDGVHLVVGDSTNNRVLIWNTIPHSMMTPADLVLGQPNFSSSTANQGITPSASTLSGPTGTVIVNNHLLIEDSGNSRLLIWNTFPTAIDQPADIVLGQTSFSGVMPNQGMTPSASTFRGGGAGGMNFVQNRLFVSDWNNNRVLIWNSFPTYTDQPADLVLGQATFAGVTANQGSSVGANTLAAPSGIASDGIHLAISDYNNHRALLWNSLPTIIDQPADVVLGQADFHSANLITTATNSSVEYVAGAMIDRDGALYIGDEGPGRILVWSSFPTQVNQPATSVLGQSSLLGGSQNCGGATPSAQCMANPWGLSTNDLAQGVITPTGY